MKSSDRKTIRQLQSQVQALMNRVSALEKRLTTATPQVGFETGGGDWPVGQHEDVSAPVTDAEREAFLWVGDRKDG